MSEPQGEPRRPGAAARAHRLMKAATKYTGRWEEARQSTSRRKKRRLPLPRQRTHGPARAETATSGATAPILCVERLGREHAVEAGVKLGVVQVVLRDEHEETAERQQGLHATCPHQRAVSGAATEGKAARCAPRLYESVRKSASMSGVVKCGTTWSGRRISTAL